MEKMKVAMLTPDYYPDFYAGVGVHVYSLVNYLKEYFEIEITVIVLRCDSISDSKPKIYEAPEGVKVIEFVGAECRECCAIELDYFTYKWTRNNITAIEYLETIMTDLNFDLVHCHDMFPIWIMDFLRRKFNIPVISTIHARSADEKKIEDSLRGFLVKTSDVCLAVSKSLASELQQRYGDMNIKVIYNGVSPSVSSKTNIKKQYITYCGRLASTKGVENLITAFLELHENQAIDSNIKLLIMGQGELEEELKKLAEKSDKIIFKGMIKNDVARKIMSESLVHVIPSLYEPFATSALEAMEEGTAVIASAVGGLKEMVENMENGILVEPGDVQALKNSLKMLLDNDVIRDKLVKKAQIYVKQYRWTEICKQIMNQYIFLVDN